MEIFSCVMFDLPMPLSQPVTFALAKDVVSFRRIIGRTSRARLYLLGTVPRGRPAWLVPVGEAPANTYMLEALGGQDMTMLGRTTVVVITADELALAVSVTVFVVVSVIAGIDVPKFADAEDGDITGVFLVEDDWICLRVRTSSAWWVKDAA